MLVSWSVHELDRLPTLCSRLKLFNIIQSWRVNQFTFLPVAYLLVLPFCKIETVQKSPGGVGCKCVPNTEAKNRLHIPLNRDTNNGLYLGVRTCETHG